MNAVVKKIETILRSSYDTKNYVDLIREIFPKVSIVSPDKFRKEFTNFSSHIEGSVHVGNYKTPDKKNIIIMAVQLKNVGKGKYMYPVVKTADLKNMSVKRFNESRSSKIIIGGMNKVLECFYDEGDFLAGKSTTIANGMRVWKLKDGKPLGSIQGK